MIPEAEYAVPAEKLSHNTKNLSCPENTVIFVEYAAYGRLSPDLISSEQYCFDTASLYKTVER